MRVLLGIAEAGFFPGIIFYLTLWFPGGLSRADHRLLHGGDSAVHRDRRADLGVAARDGRHRGLKGWQWMFILEAMPSLILSVVVFFYLTDRPADATWLAPEERAWLARRLTQERRQRERCARTA